MRQLIALFLVIFCYKNQGFSSCEMLTINSTESLRQAFELYERAATIPEQDSCLPSMRASILKAWRDPRINHSSLQEQIHRFKSQGSARQFLNVKNTSHIPSQTAPSILVYEGDINSPHAKHITSTIQQISPHAIITPMNIQKINGQEHTEASISENSSFFEPYKVVNASFTDFYAQARNNKASLRAILNSSALLVKASGNSGLSLDQHASQDYLFLHTLEPQLLTDGMILVGALEYGNLLAKFSNRPGRNPLFQENFVWALGEDVLADVDGTLQRQSGTSMAAPSVTAVVARIAEEHPLFSKTDLKHCILASAKQDFWVHDHQHKLSIHIAPGIPPSHKIEKGYLIIEEPFNPSFWGKGILDLESALEYARFYEKCGKNPETAKSLMNLFVKNKDKRLAAFLDSKHHPQSSSSSATEAFGISIETYHYLSVLRFAQKTRSFVLSTLILSHCSHLFSQYENWHPDKRLLFSLAINLALSEDQTTQTFGLEKIKEFLDSDEWYAFAPTLNMPSLPIFDIWDSENVNLMKIALTFPGIKTSILRDFHFSSDDPKFTKDSPDLARNLIEEKAKIYSINRDNLPFPPNANYDQLQHWISLGISAKALLQFTYPHADYDQTSKTLLSLDKTSHDVPLNEEKAKTLYPRLFEEKAPPPPVPSQPLIAEKPEPLPPQVYFLKNPLRYGNPSISEEMQKQLKKMISEAHFIPANIRQGYEVTIHSNDAICHFDVFGRCHINPNVMNIFSIPEEMKDGSYASIYSFLRAALDEQSVLAIKSSGLESKPVEVLEGYDLNSENGLIFIGILDQNNIPLAGSNIPGARFKDIFLWGMPLNEHFNATDSASTLAALIASHYPEFSRKQIKECILNSANREFTLLYPNIKLMVHVYDPSQHDADHYIDTDGIFHVYEPFNPEFWGKGIMNQERALKYAELLSKHSNPEEFKKAWSDDAVSTENPALKSGNSKPFSLLFVEWASDIAPEKIRSVRSDVLSSFMQQYDPYKSDQENLLGIIQDQPTLLSSEKAAQSIQVLQKRHAYFYEHSRQIQDKIVEVLLACAPQEIVNLYDRHKVFFDNKWSNETPLFIKMIIERKISQNSLDLLDFTEALSPFIKDEDIYTKIMGSRILQTGDIGILRRFYLHAPYKIQESFLSRISTNNKIVLLLGEGRSPESLLQDMLYINNQEEIITLFNLVPDLSSKITFRDLQDILKKFMNSEAGVAFLGNLLEQTQALFPSLEDKQILLKLALLSDNDAIVRKIINLTGSEQEAIKQYGKEVYEPIYKKESHPNAQQNSIARVLGIKVKLTRPTRKTLMFDDV